VGRSTGCWAVVPGAPIGAGRSAGCCGPPEVGPPAGVGRSAGCWAVVPGAPIGAGRSAGRCGPPEVGPPAGVGRSAGCWVVVPEAPIGAGRSGRASRRLEESRVLTGGGRSGIPRPPAVGGVAAWEAFDGALGLGSSGADPRPAVVVGVGRSGISGGGGVRIGFEGVGDLAAGATGAGRSDTPGAGGARTGF
jgi:hypothetical protein